MVEANEEAKNATFYGEDIFDDIIANALDSSGHGAGHAGDGNAPSRHSGNASLEPTKKKRNKNNSNGNRNRNDYLDPDKDDIEEGREDGSSKSDISDGDADSLGSEEISGESDVSEVEESEKSYIAPPLVNDDEETVDIQPPAPQSQTVSSYVDQLNRAERSKGRLIKAGGAAICIAIVVGVALAVVSLTGKSNGVDDGPGAQVSAPREVPTTPASMNQTITLPTLASSQPTKRPVAPLPVDIETLHPIQLTFQNMPVGYRLPADKRESLIDFIEELLRDYFENSIQLVEVAYARDGGIPPRRLSTESFSLPLRFLVRAPSSLSTDFLQTYIVNEVDERSRNIENYFRGFVCQTCQSVNIVADTYDFADLYKPTPAPSSSPTTRPPTRPPTNTPTLSPLTRKPTPFPSVSPVQLPTSSPIQSTTSNTKPISITKPEAITKPPIPAFSTVVTTPAPVTPYPTPNPTNSPTKDPTPRPTKNPTLRPTRTPTPQPTFRPTRRPTPRPTPRPTFRITPRPTRRPTPRPTNRPVYWGGGTDGATLGSTAGDNPSSSSYYCASKSETEGGNFFLDFDCSLSCPTDCGIVCPASCPGGYECRLEPKCDDYNGRRQRQ
mmetsp:Transcript_4194/g.9307  ORF Transcript_4194/g.9307 Transcript_4194/m.9307 type:complete len:610 (+) Transcript_4194:220-2049(+)